MLKFKKMILPINFVIIFVFLSLCIVSAVFFEENTAFALEDIPKSGRAEDIVQSTYPAHNQTQVEVKPTIKIVFNYPVEIVQKDKISLKAGEERYELRDDEIFLLEDEKTLCIDVGRIGRPPLMRNTLYSLTLEAGAVKLKDSGILNEEFTISFVTRSEGESPRILGFSSSPTGSDDITSVNDTRLSSEGNIYIFFDRSIKWEKNTGLTQILEGTKLYRIPKPSETSHDADGKKYDKAFEFETEITEDDLKSGDYQEPVEIGEVEIVNNTTVRIKPKDPLLSLNMYRLTVKKELIEDINGYSLEEDVDFYFWTAPSYKKIVPKWKGIEGLPSDKITDDSATSGKTYEVIGTPCYGPEIPVVFSIEGEVIPKAGEISVLKRISLVEGYMPENTVKISKIRLEYEIEGERKNTKLKIFPDQTLDYGKFYVLTIPDDVLQSRSGHFLPSFNMKFTVAGNPDDSGGIYYIEPDEFSLFDIYEGDSSFDIKGFNFTEDIEYLQLEMISGENAGNVKAAVYKKDIEFKSITELNVKLRDKDIIDTLLSAGSGEYALLLHFSGHSLQNPQATLKILPKGRPQVIEKDPPGDEIWANEKMLNPRTIDGTTRYFLKLTFEDIDGSLAFDTEGGLTRLADSAVFSEGQNEVSMIDTEFIYFVQNLEDEDEKDYYINKYIFVKDQNKKEAYLYIPVKPLRSGTTYNVMINSGIVYFAGENWEQHINDVVYWSFTTSAVPVISANEAASVIEDYDEDVPIILKGDFFDEFNVEVFFNDIRARKVRYRTDENGSPYLEVFLPDGKDRLDPGLYSVLVRNDRDHEFELFGALSVVEEGDYVPNEEYRIKAEERIGEVLSIPDRSEDVLVINRKYTDRSRVEVNLDELMGPDTYIRKIEFDGRKNDRIGTLKTLSKWADITLYDIGCADYDSDTKPQIALGRVHPAFAESLREKLVGRQINSEFIQATGENVRFTSLSIQMPFFGSDGENLKVLRYDQYTREFIEEHFSVDKIEKTVTIKSFSPGIFVVISS